MKSADKQEPDGNSLLLRASAKRLFESLMEQTTDHIYIKDRNSRFIAASEALARAHGFSGREKLEGLTDFDLFSEEHAKQAFQDEQEIIRTGKPMSKVEKETWHKGADTWVSTTKAPLYLNSGKVAGIMGISRDVTAEIIAQMQLAESERRLREQNEIMRSDYESAHKVQSFMIPGRVPHIKNVEIGYLWKPMTSVGGDIINFPRNPSNCFLFFMGDVCGHGVTAAFYTVLLKYLTGHAAEVYNDNPQDFLNAVNTQITGRMGFGFITGLAGHFGARKKDGSRNLILSNAGHRQVLVYRKKSQTTELIDLPTGTVLGIPGCSASNPKAISLEIGDRFYAFTDGILESSDPAGNEFGMDQIRRSLEELSVHPISTTLNMLYDTVSSYTKSPNQQDDISLIGFELT